MNCFHELGQSHCLVIFLVTIVVLAMAIYLTMDLSNKTQHENGLLESKYSGCRFEYVYNDDTDDDNISITLCYAYFNMYITDKNKYCIVKQDNITYNDYTVNEIYKLKDIITSGNTTTCNFGKEQYTNNTIYSIGISLFAVFVIMFCSIYTYVKLKALSRPEVQQPNIYPIADAERCINSSILVAVTNDDLPEGEYINFNEDEIVVSRV